MALSVHLLDPLAPAELELLLAELPAEVELRLSEGPEPPPDCEVLVGGRPERAQVEACPRLRHLIIPWAGVPEPTRELMRDYRRVSVHNLHYNAAPTAEMALALLLAAARRLVPIDRALRQGDWSPRYEEPSPGVCLDGRTALLLGYGAIGRRLGAVCQALGMRVLAVRRHGPGGPPDPGIELHSLADLPDLLPRAEALLIALPLTPATRGLIGARELERLPPAALLVNIGRGPIVDEAALFDALRSGRLGAAGLDVWYRYPQSEAERTHTLPSQFPFHTLDNVVLSPHRGGGCDSSEPARLRHLARLLAAAASDEPVPNRVDLEAGY